MCILENSNKIIHKSVKARKEFILDLVFVGIGVSLLHVALNENFTKDSEVKSIHKNKDRKVHKKLIAYQKELLAKQHILFRLMSQSDLQTVKHKTSQTAIAFMSEISDSNESVNLEYIAINIMYLGLKRKHKFTMHPTITPFKDEAMLFLNIGDLVESVGIEPDVEFRLAQSFVSTVKY